MDSELNNYGIDPQTGFVSGNSFLVGSEGRCFTMDPQGRFLVVGIGRIEGIIGVLPIAADTGIPGGTFVETSLGLRSFPNEISTEVTGSFINLTYLNGTNPPVHIFAIDPQTQWLTETASSPLPGFTSVPALMLDPTGPFMYQSDATGTSVQAFQIDPLTGYFTAVAGTTISAPGVNGSYVFSIVPGQQNLVGPQASLTPAALSLGNVTVGTVSPAQPIVLTSTGDQALSLTSISIGGANGVLVVMVTYAAASLGGCGGGSSGALVTPPPVITPAGTSTIVITPTVMSATGQPLQLPPIQLTLTVN